MYDSSDGLSAWAGLPLVALETLAASRSTERFWREGFMMHVACAFALAVCMMVLPRPGDARASVWLEAEIVPPVGSDVEIGQLLLRSASVAEDALNDVVIRFVDGKHLDFDEEWTFDAFRIGWPDAVFVDPTRTMQAEDMDGSVLAAALYTYSNPPNDQFSPRQEGGFAAVESVHQIRYVDAFGTSGSGVPEILLDMPDFTTAVVGAWPVPEPSALVGYCVCGLSVLAYRGWRRMHPRGACGGRICASSRS